MSRADARPRRSARRREAAEEARTARKRRQGAGRATGGGRFAWEARSVEVPKHIETDPVNARDVVGDARNVGNLVPGEEELGAERHVREDAGVVGEAAGEREARRRGGSGARSEERRVGKEGRC